MSTFQDETITNVFLKNDGQPEKPIHGFQAAVHVHDLLIYSDVRLITSKDNKVDRWHCVLTF